MYTYSIFSGNSEANASEFLENLEELRPRYYMKRTSVSGSIFQLYTIVTWRESVDAQYIKTTGENKIEPLHLYKLGQYTSSSVSVCKLNSLPSEEFHFVYLHLAEEKS